MSLRHIPLLNILFSVLSSMTMRLCSIIVTTILVKGIGQAEFGHYMYIITTALMLSSISSMSTGQAFTREVSKENQSYGNFPSYLINLFALFTTFSILFCSYAFYVTPNQYITDNLGVILAISALEVANLAFTSLFSGKEQFKKVLQARLIFSVVLCATVGSSIYLDSYLSVYPYILAIFLSNLYLLSQSDVSSKAFCFAITRQNSLKSFYHRYLKLSFPIFISGLMVTPVQWFLSNQIAVQNSFAELGLFNISMQFRMMILMVTNAIATALLPRLSMHSGSDGFNQIKQAGYYFSGLFCLVTIAGVVFIMPFVFDFYEIATNETVLYGSYLLLATALPLCLYNIYTQVLIACGNTRTLLLFNSFWGILVIVLYSLSNQIDTLSAAKILCISYFALIVFVFLFNILLKIKTRPIIQVRGNK